MTDLGALSGSREPSPDGLGPSGFDPERKAAAHDPAQDHCTCPQWGNPSHDPYYQCAYCERQQEQAARYDRVDEIADACIAAANAAGPTLHLEQHDAIRRTVMEQLYGSP